MVSFVPLLGIQIGVVSLVGRYMGAGAGDRRARDPLRSEDGLVLLVGHPGPLRRLPEQLVAVFRPAARPHLFRGGPLAAGMLRLAGLYVLADAMMVVFSGALRGAGDTFWTMCISVGLHWLLLPVLFITLKILQLSPQTAWLGAGYPLPFLQRRFLPALPQRPLEDPDGGGREADRVAGIRRRGFRIFAAIGTAGPP